MKTDRLEARISPGDRLRIEQAASATGVSVSAFMVGAAVERADDVIAAAASTTVSGDYFDELLAALDEAGSAPALARAAQRVDRVSRIAPL